MTVGDLQKFEWSQNSVRLLGNLESPKQDLPTSHQNTQCLLGKFPVL